MKSISFKNFRRFADFPEFKFGDITILVGGNNAGKSTLQKALLLVFDNLKTLKKKASKFNRRVYMTLPQKERATRLPLFLFTLCQSFPAYVRNNYRDLHCQVRQAFHTKE